MACSFFAFNILFLYFCVSIQYFLYFIIYSNLTVVFILFLLQNILLSYWYFCFFNIIILFWCLFIFILCLIFLNIFIFIFMIMFIFLSLIRRMQKLVRMSRLLPNWLFMVKSLRIWIHSHTSIFILLNILSAIKLLNYLIFHILFLF